MMTVAELQSFIADYEAKIPAGKTLAGVGLTIEDTIDRVKALLAQNLEDDAIALAETLFPVIIPYVTVFELLTHLPGYRAAQVGDLVWRRTDEDPYDPESEDAQ